MTRQMRYSVCVCMCLSVSVSQTHAVIQPSHALRFPSFSPKVQGRKVGKCEQNLVDGCWLSTMLQQTERKPESEK